MQINRSNRLLNVFFLVCLALLAFLAVLGPELLGQDGVKAPSYSKPWWLSRDIAPTVILYAAVQSPTLDEELPWPHIMRSSESVSLEWEY